MLIKIIHMDFAKEFPEILVEWNQHPLEKIHQGIDYYKTDDLQFVQKLLTVDKILCRFNKAWMQGSFKDQKQCIQDIENMGNQMLNKDLSAYEKSFSNSFSLSDDEAD